MSIAIHVKFRFNHILKLTIVTCCLLFLLVACYYYLLIVITTCCLLLLLIACYYYLLELILGVFCMTVNCLRLFIMIVSSVVFIPTLLHLPKNKLVSHNWLKTVLSNPVGAVPQVCIAFKCIRSL